jgi:hypothetical protein
MGQAQTAEGPRLPRGAAPAAPVYSRDGTVVVYAPGDKAGYRMPVLTFVTQFSAELQRVLRLKLGSQLAPLEVAIGGQSDGDTRVLTVRLRDAGGGVVRERIELPDPEAADLDLFRRAVCVALLRGWMAEAGGTEATMQDVPGWLIDGLLRYIDRRAAASGRRPHAAALVAACLPRPPRCWRRTAWRPRASLRSRRARELADGTARRGFASRSLLRAAATGTRGRSARPRGC